MIILSQLFECRNCSGHDFCRERGGAGLCRELALQLGLPKSGQVWRYNYENSSFRLKIGTEKTLEEVQAIVALFRLKYPFVPDIKVQEENKK